MQHTFKHGTIHHGDCLELMRDIPDGSVDMVLADLPYGTTACKWDTVIPFEPLWEAYKRIRKERAAIVLTASQPFTSALISSNIKMFKYEWIWDKVYHANFMNTKYQPCKIHENICVFGKHAFYPIKTKGMVNHARGANGGFSRFLNQRINKTSDDYSGMKFPKSIMTFPKHSTGSRHHPTQKPVTLFEYLVRTYTNKGDTVLDNVIGSGTTGVAAYNTGRRFIGMEKDKEIYDMAVKRIDSETKQLHLFDPAA